ncbi:MAG: hypothetical protein GY929_27810 [Actinomycetia bacterium]|nr:hypothetical protein [Actinomycetes bacterium]
MTEDQNKDRKALHAYVTSEAHDLWHDTCAEEGVSVSALLEILAHRLQDLMADDGLVKSARRLDAERRRRR